MENKLCTDLPDLLKKTVNRAIMLSEKADSKYYGYNVCAIVIDEDNNEFAGVNWEPANGSTTCAEVGALSNYVLSERKKIKYVVTFGKSKGREPNSEVYCTPCGACRQRLNDYCSKDTVVVGINETGNKVNLFEFGELLPFSFNSENL